MALLTGIRVLDLTAAAAGPFASQMMADMGAEVIKVEPPGGEHGRHWGNWRFEDKSFLFLAVNRNKRSVVIDLKSDEGKKQMAELVATADVVVESYAPPRARQFGIDYETLKAYKPDLIYVSVSGYGLTGPKSLDNGMDMLLQAYTGITSYTGEPGRPPVRIAVSALDLMTGAMGFAGMLAALRDRDMTGEGQVVDVSLYDSAMSILLWAIPQTSATGKNPSKLGSDFEHLFPYAIWEASDGYVFIGAPTDAIWVKLCAELGIPDVASDPRYRTNPDRISNREEVRAILKPLFAAETVQKWIDRLTSTGALVSKIREVSEAIDDPHAEARGAVRTLPGYPNIKVAGPPLHMDRGFIPDSEWTDPPFVGSHNDFYLHQEAVED
jgi:crotonobetainyl-CoA:carnitine CoA-transferase CaiB-like acyl-CoA transferase